MDYCRYAYFVSYHRRRDRLIFPLCWKRITDSIKSEPTVSKMEERNRSTPSTTQSRCGHNITTTTSQYRTIGFSRNITPLCFKATLVVMGVILLSKVAVQLLDIAVTFLLSLFLAAAFSPAVNRLGKWRIPRGIGIILLFFLVFGF